MASNKENQLVEKNDDNLGVENISNDHSTESEKKIEGSKVRKNLNT